MSGHVFHFTTDQLADPAGRSRLEEDIARAVRAGKLISFDTARGSALWESEGAMKLAVEEFLLMADVVEVDAEDLVTVAGTTDLEEAARVLLQGRTRLFMCMEYGEVYLFTENAFAEAGGDTGQMEDERVIRGLLERLSRDERTPEELASLTDDQLAGYVREALSI